MAQMLYARYHTILILDNVYFRIEDEMVIVFGLFHCARDPRTIRAQLQDRDALENP